MLWLWKCLGFGFLLGIVCLSTASQVAVFLTGNMPGYVGIPIVAALVLLSLVCHALLLFTGPKMEEARRYLAVKRRYRKLCRKVRKLLDRLEASEAETVDRLRLYKAELARYEAEYGEAIEPGPFERCVLEVVERRYPE